MKDILDILVVGSVALDSIETPDTKVKNVLGGSAVYFAWAASYFSRVGIVGAIGEDFSEGHINILKNRAVDLKGLKRYRGKTFHWSGRYGENSDDRETLSVCQNVFAGFHPELPVEYRHPNYVFLANIDPDLHLEVLSQIENPKFIAADTMNIWIETKRESLLETMKKIDLMILNDSEARQLTNENNLIKAARSIISFGPKTVIIKKGGNGAILLGKNTLFSIPAYPVEKVVDPTGAGDTFAGAFLGFLFSSGNINEENFRKAVVYGSVTASFCIEDFSLNRLRTVSKQDITARVEELRQITQF